MVGNGNPEVVNTSMVAIGEQDHFSIPGTNPGNAKGKKELEKSFLYVTFDIIKERIIEVKEFGKLA